MSSTLLLSAHLLVVQMVSCCAALVSLLLKNSINSVHVHYNHLKTTTLQNINTKITIIITPIINYTCFSFPDELLAAHGNIIVGHFHSLAQFLAVVTFPVTPPPFPMKFQNTSNSSIPTYPMIASGLWRILTAYIFDY